MDFRRVFSREGLESIGMGCPGCQHPWKGSRNVWMWHWKPQLMAGFADFRGLFQPEGFHDSGRAAKAGKGWEMWKFAKDRI